MWISGAQTSKEGLSKEIGEGLKRGEKREGI
jgi:hypothetical protein